MYFDKYLLFDFLIFAKFLISYGLKINCKHDT
jgi:hypothetical protein